MGLPDGVPSTRLGSLHLVQRLNGGSGDNGDETLGGDDVLEEIEVGRQGHVIDHNVGRVVGEPSKGSGSRGGPLAIAPLF